MPTSGFESSSDEEFQVTPGPRNDVDEVQKDTGKKTFTSKGIARISEEEASYRVRNFEEIDITKEKVFCTGCKKKLVDTSSVRRHSVLGVLFCKQCSDFYDDGEFSLDEDGTDKYCRWCGQGGTLYLCACNSGFCGACIKRNLGRSTLAAVEEEEDWKCFICNNKPLWKLRALCEAFMMRKQKLTEMKSRLKIKINEELSSEKGERDKRKTVNLNCEKDRKQKCPERNVDKENTHFSATKDAKKGCEKGGDRRDRKSLLSERSARNVVDQQENKRKLMESDPECEQKLKKFKSKSVSDSKVNSYKTSSSEKEERNVQGKKYNKRKDTETVLDEKSAEELSVQLKDSIYDVKDVFSEITKFIYKIYDNMNVRNMLKFKRRHEIIDDIKKLGSISVQAIQLAVGNVDMRYKGYMENYHAVKENNESDVVREGNNCSERKAVTEDDSDDGEDGEDCEPLIKLVQSKQSLQGACQRKKYSSHFTEDQAADPIKADENRREIKDQLFFCKPVNKSETDKVKKRDKAILAPHKKVSPRKCNPDLGPIKQMSSIKTRVKVMSKGKK